MTAQVPAREAFATVRTLRSTVLLIASLLGVVLLGGVAVLAAVLRGRDRAERSLQSSEDRTRSILEAAKDAFVAIDASGLITAWNAQAEAIFGWTRDEVLGHPVTATIVPPEHRAAHEAGVRRIRDDPRAAALSRRLELSALRRDGVLLPVELALWAVSADGDISFNAFIHDISDRKQAERELREARDKAMAASRLKSEFLATMSHEIRTPMNGVIGMTELLLDSELSDEHREYAETVRASGEALMTVLNDILDFSKIEAGRLTLERIDFAVHAVVEESAELLAAAAQKKGLELVTEVDRGVPAWLRGDPTRLRQVLLNLVGNAVKFTERGEIVVRADLVEETEEASVVRFEVADTGIGVAPEDQDRLFDSFQQLDGSTTRRYGGTGLGLAICRQLVELMGGRIGVDSAPRTGSRFWFTVRLYPAGPVPEPAVERGTAELRGLRALVIDDNATNRRILAETLQRWGIESTAAVTADAALRQLQVAADTATPYDLVLLDYHMPGMNGVELAHVINADPSLAGTPLLLLTSQADGAVARRAEAAGIRGWLMKPVRRKALFDLIDRVTGRSAVTPRPGSTLGRRPRRERRAQPSGSSSQKTTP